MSERPLRSWPQPDQLLDVGMDLVAPVVEPEVAEIRCPVFSVEKLDTAPKICQTRQNVTFRISSRMKLPK